MQVKGHGILGRPGLSAVCLGPPPKGQSAFSWSRVSRVPWSLPRLETQAGAEPGFWCVRATILALEVALGSGRSEVGPAWGGQNSEAAQGHGG